MEPEGKNYNETKSNFSYYPFKTVKFSRKKGTEEAEDPVTVEEPMEIRLCRRNGDCDKIAVTMRTPSDDFSLAAGFLFNEGIIKSRDEILGIEHSDDEGDAGRNNIVKVFVKDSLDYNASANRRNFSMSSSCGICGKNEINQVFLKGSSIIKANRKIRVETILNLPDAMREHQNIFNVTGGIHAAGVFDYDGNLIHLAEDVGRHNAVDKITGKMLLKGEIPASDRILQISGRAGFEIAQKAVRAGFPILSSVSAPSSLAVETAETFNLTLVCFVRGERLNIYSHGERILYQ